MTRARSRHDWPAQAHRVLRRHRVTQVSYVPDAGHRRLIDLCRADRTMRAVPLTTEEEGVALAAGAWLGGARSALLMQSSGVGNCVNTLCSLTQSCGLPLLMLVTMRGEWGEFNPWQVPMGQATRKSLETCGVIVLGAEAPQAVRETVEAAVRLAFDSHRAVAVLLSQRLIGTKSFKD